MRKGGRGGGVPHATRSTLQYPCFSRPCKLPCCIVQSLPASLSPGERHVGVTCCHCLPLPLLSPMQGNVKLLMEDVAALRPTLFIAVPRIIERVEDGGVLLDLLGSGFTVRVCVCRASCVAELCALNLPAAPACLAPPVTPAAPYHTTCGPFLPFCRSRAVRAKLKKASKVSQLLFSAAYNYKLFLLKSGVPFG